MQDMFRALALGALGLVALPAAAQTTAEEIYSGGPILTMNDAAPRAEALAIAGGRILAVGTLDDIAPFRGEGTKVIDLGGRTLIPGFVDAHGHVMMGGLQALSANLLPAPDGPVNDIPALQATLRDWIAANADAVKAANLIIGFGYDNGQLAEQRHPTRDDLDAISTEVPILIVHQSGHLGVLNSKALESVGLSAASADPEGGVIQRRPGSAEPNGVLEETAFNATLPVLLGGVGVEGARAFADAGAKLWARYGYTTAQEGRSVPGTAGILRAVAEDGKFAIDVNTYPDVLVDRDWIKANVSATYQNHFRVAGAKLTIDGSPQGFTAWRDRPYFAPVGNYPPGYVGYASASRDDVIGAVDWAYANDIQILTHANGEAAGDLLIAAIRQAQEAHGGTDRRPVLIHGQFERLDQVDAYKDLGVFPSLFPMHTFYWGDWHRDHTVGPADADNISPTGWFTQRGVPFSSHHDAPVALPDSMRVLDATVTRRSRSGDIIGPAQRVPVLTALKSMTLWPAHSFFEEKEKGSLEPGKLADLVILSDDPTAVDPETLDQLQVLETIKEGETVFRLGPEEIRKGEMMWPRDRPFEPMQNLMRALFLQRGLERLPPQYRTADARARLDALFDDCAAGLVLADMMGLGAAGVEVAER